jgi:TusA-related sulfurtransferase
MIKVDARGCACPQPVLMTKNAMAKDNSVEVMVDNNTAKNNVERFARNNGAKVEIKAAEAPDEYVLVIEK